MDRHLKERMIGAIVLVAAAIVLIPEMLSGPRISAVTSTGEASLSASSAPGQEGGKFKTYTIDLAKAATTDLKSNPIPEKALEAAQPIVTTPAPPDESTSLPNALASESKRPVNEQKGTTATQPVAPVAATKPEAAAALKSPPVKASPTQTASAESGWAVQVGSFSVRATSDRLAGELKQAGFSSYVVAFQSGNQTMYRVRVGPARDRSAAEALLNKVKSQHPTATLVPPA